MRWRGCRSRSRSAPTKPATPRADLDRLAGKYDAVNIKLDKTGGLTEALALGRGGGGARLQDHGRLHDRHARWRWRRRCWSRSSAAIVDLDAPLLLAGDRVPGLRYDGSTVYPPEPVLWG